MPTEVHLPEPVLGVDEPLGEEEVAGRVRFDAGDAGGIAGDDDLGVEAGDAQRSVGGGEGAADDADAEEDGDEKEDDEGRDDAEDGLHAQGQVGPVGRAHGGFQRARHVSIRGSHGSPSTASPQSIGAHRRERAGSTPADGSSGGRGG